MRRTLRGLCRAVFWTYVLGCLAAVLVIPASSRGLLGLEPDPLAAVFAIGLALPWSLPLLRIFDGAGPGFALLLLVAGMVLNAAILRTVCRR